MDGWGGKRMVGMSWMVEEGGKGMLVGGSCIILQAVETGGFMHDGKGV